MSSTTKNGCSSCNCCPYGYHIDVDFVRYCEALLAALYGSKVHSLSKESNRSKQLKLLHEVPREVVGLSPTTNAFHICDHNSNNKSISSNCLSNLLNKVPQSPATTVSHDLSLNDAVAKFEETWSKSSNKRSTRSNSCVSERSASQDTSLPPSPAPSYASTQAALSKAVLSEIRDQMALSISRIKELEDQAKDIPKLKQKIIFLREERKKLLKRLEGERDEDNCFSEFPIRLKKLEKSGFITPPMMRRKLILKSDSEDSDEDFWLASSATNFPGQLLPTENICLVSNEKIEVAAQTDPCLKTSVSTNTEKTKLMRTISTNTEIGDPKSLTFDNLKAIDIEPVTKNTRSVGIATRMPPPLPKRSIYVETDLKASDTISLKDLQALKPAKVSWGTDPLIVNSCNVQCQATPETINVSTKTDLNISKKVLRHFSTQTEEAKFFNKSSQITSSCSKCELRQTETVGVGDSDIRGKHLVDKAILTEIERPKSLEIINANLPHLPVSRTSSTQSIRLCDKCNETITSCAKEVVISLNEKTPSPTLQSRIPRLSPHNSDRSKQETTPQIIIEENENEMLVYRNPLALSAGSSPVHSRVPPLPPPRRKEYSHKDVQKIDEIFKNAGISESDESDISSDEGTYDISSGVVAKPKRQPTEPSKEIKAALKVLNDNLIKPEKANKSSLVILKYFDILKSKLIV